jgi:hypothetical protein
MRRLLLAILIIGFTLSWLGSGSLGHISDTEVSTGNSVSAGVWEDSGSSGEEQLGTEAEVSMDEPAGDSGGDGGLD